MAAAAEGGQHAPPSDDDEADIDEAPAVITEAVVEWAQPFDISNRDETAYFWLHQIALAYDLMRNLPSNVNILVYGAFGSGKSAYINTILNAFSVNDRPRVYAMARSAPVHVTSDLSSFTIPPDDPSARVRLIDPMGASTHKTNAATLDIQVTPSDVCQSDRAPFAGRSQSR
jgi:hypothetical protein